MKRILIIVLLVLALVATYMLVKDGLEIKNIKFKIYSYSEIKDDSDSLTTAVGAYNRKNTTEYQAALTNLKTSIKKYKTAKEQYEELIEEISTNEQVDNGSEIVINTNLPVYELSYLWVKMGNYAKSEGLDLTLSLEKASTVAATGTISYDLYNLKLNVTGEYINIANFLYDLEDDDELGFEIRDYSMVDGVASFTIYNVPLNSESISQIEAEQNINQADSADSNTATANTATSNTTTNSVSSNTANTINTAVNTTNTASTGNTANVANTSNAVN